MFLNFQVNLASVLALIQPSCEGTELFETFELFEPFVLFENSNGEPLELFEILELFESLVQFDELARLAGGLTVKKIEIRICYFFFNFWNLWI